MRKFKILSDVAVDRDYTDIIPHFRLTIARWDGFFNIQLAFSFLSFYAAVHLRRVNND